MVSPYGVEGAAVIYLSGNEVTNPTVDSGALFFEVDGNVTRLVIIRYDPGGISFTVRVPERGEPPDATVVEVADGENQIRNQLAGYRVDFTPVPDPPSSRSGTP